MPILAVSDASARDKVLHDVRSCYLSGKQLEWWAWAAHKEIFNPPFPPACCVALSHPTSLHLPFPAFCTMGRAFYFVPALVCCWSFTAVLNSTASWGTLQWGFNTPGVGLLKLGQLRWCMLSPWRSPSPESLDLFPFCPLFLFFAARTCSTLNLLNQGWHNSKAPLKWRFSSLWITSPFLLIWAWTAGIHFGLLNGKGTRCFCYPVSLTCGTFCGRCARGRFGLCFFEVGSFFSACPEPKPVKYKSPLAFVQYFFIYLLPSGVVESVRFSSTKGQLNLCPSTPLPSPNS